MHLSALALLALAAAVPVRAQAGTDVIHSITAVLQEQQYEHALQLIQGELRHSPNDVRLWTLQGIARSRLSNDSEAIISFDHALKLKRDYLPALEGAAQIEYLAGSNRAIPLLERLLLVRPDDQTAHAMRAAMAYKHRDCQSATEHFSHAGAVISSQASALDEYAACLAMLKRRDEAISVLQKLVALKPADPRARMKLAAMEFMGQRAKDVIQTLRPLVENETPDPDALDLVSAAYEVTGDTPQALETLRRAIVSATRNVDYYLDFADLSFAHSFFQIGIDMMNTGLSLLPNSAPLYVARGVLLIQMAKYDQAEADFETAQRVDPNQALGSAAKGLAEIQQNNLDQALQTVKVQLRQKPNDAFLYYLLAEILARHGALSGTSEVQQAIKAALHAVQLNPDLSIAHNVLARLYLNSGNVSLAIEQSRLALRADPSDQTALYHLILALRRSEKGDQIPPLLKRLAAVREHAANEEARYRRYGLFEPRQSVLVSSDER